MSRKAGPKTTESGFDVDPTGADDEIDQLRRRVKELEKQLRSRPTEPQSSRSTGGALKIATASLAATTALFAAPAYASVRRWWRWWQE
jgi:hypothetical protein